MDTKRAYLPHLYEPLRRSIAERYIKNELRKLFPSLRLESEWEKLDFDVSQWYQGNPTLIPVRDFWNGLHAISSGFKLKDVVPYLTSLHMKWEEIDIQIDRLWFGKNFPELAHLPDRPSAIEVREWYFAPENVEALEHARLEHERRSQQSFARDDFPVMAIQKEGRLTIIDGDRRLLKKILLARTTITAVVATPIKEPAVYEYWVPTSFLLDLISFHRYYASLGKDCTKSVGQVIADCIRDSSAGRIEFSHRCTKVREEADSKLWKCVFKILQKNGIDLDPIEH